MNTTNNASLTKGDKGNVARVCKSVNVVGVAQWLVRALRLIWVDVGYEDYLGNDPAMPDTSDREATELSGHPPHSRRPMRT